MRTIVDTDAGAERPHRRRARWLAALAALVLVAAVAVGLRLAGGGDGGGGDGGGPDPAAEPASLPEQLAARVVEILEQSSTSEHAEHGHHFDEAAVSILCAAETFGFDPPEATTVEDVEVVYAQHMCAEVGTGFPWPDAVRAAGPIAVELADPATVLLPEQALPDQEGVNHADRIRAIIPEQYHEAALPPAGFADPAVADRLRNRFEAASS